MRDPYEQPDAEAHVLWADLIEQNWTTIMRAKPPIDQFKTPSFFGMPGRPA
jgi:hypothetical protein